MNEVKRYESGVHYCSGDAMVQSTEGDFVSYDDYAALKAECESNAKSAQYSAETNRKISRKNGEMHEEISSLKAERDALAAENGTLKSYLKECSVVQGEGNWTSDNEKSVYVPAVEWMPETPATDAYANQLRAEGVEMFAKQTRAIGEQERCAEIIYAAVNAETFAANLRKENGND